MRGKYQLSPWISASADPMLLGENYLNNSRAYCAVVTDKAVYSVMAEVLQQNKHLKSPNSRMTWAARASQHQ